MRAPAPARETIFATLGIGSVGGIPVRFRLEDEVTVTGVRSSYSSVRKKSVDKKFPYNLSVEASCEIIAN